MDEPSSKGTNIPAEAGIHSKPCPGKVEFFHDERVEQAAQIGTGGDPVTGPGLLERAGTANVIVCFEDQDAFSRRAR
jgi:hypothetical protein